MCKMPLGEMRDDGRTQIAPLGWCLECEGQVLRDDTGKCKILKGLECQTKDLRTTLQDSH